MFKKWPQGGMTYLRVETSSYKLTVTDQQTEGRKDKRKKHLYEFALTLCPKSVMPKISCVPLNFEAKENCLQKNVKTGTPNSSIQCNFPINEKVAYPNLAIWKEKPLKKNPPELPMTPIFITEFFTTIKWMFAKTIA